MLQGCCLYIKTTSQYAIHVLLFKSRVIELYKQEWWNTVSKSTVMDVYKLFKTSLEYELCLDVLPKSLRLYFTRLRISVHPLRIQTGRYANDSKPRNEICK